MSLSGDLQNLINTYCDKTGQNLTTLSRESGVPYGSVKRIAQNDSVPELHNVLKILMVCASQDDARGFINKHYSQLGEYISQLKSKPAPLLTDRALTDKVSFYIIHMAMSKGTTREAVAEAFGRHGLNTLEDLLEQGVLQETSGVITSEEISVTDINTLVKQIHFCLEDFNPSNMGESSEHAAASLFVYELNNEGRRELNRLLKKYVAGVINIRNSPEYQGEEPTFAVCFSNILEGARK